MTERERLAELITECITIRECSFAEDKRPTCEELADYLLSNGVIAPPCKVGDIIYYTRKNDILKHRVEAIEISEKRAMLVRFSCDYSCEGCPHFEPYENQAGDGGCWGEYDEGCLSFEDMTIDENTFLTREEAEAALAERRNKC